MVWEQLSIQRNRGTPSGLRAPLMKQGSFEQTDFRERHLSGDRPQNPSKCGGYAGLQDGEDIVGRSRCQRQRQTWYWKSKDRVLDTIGLKGMPRSNSDHSNHMLFLPVANPHQSTHD